METSPRRIAVVLVLVVVAAIVVAPRLLSKKTPAPPSAAPTGAPTNSTPPAAVPVSAIVLTPQSISETLATTGTLLPNEAVDVVSEVAGKIAEIRFEEGMRVEKGHVLVKIDDSELRAQLDRARFRLELAAQREEQQRRLLDEGIISREEYESELTQKNVLQAEKALIETQLAKTEVRAPFAGVLGLRSVSLGAFLSSQTRIATLQDIDPLKLEFSLPEQYVGRIGVGDHVSYHVKGDERAREATIYVVEPAVDATTRSLVLRARSSNPGGALLPGAFADIEVAVRTVENALAVPSLAILPNLTGKRVFIVADGKAEPRDVTTGIRTATLVEVTSGLVAGDRVITSGLQGLKPGTSVRVE